MPEISRYSKMLGTNSHRKSKDLTGQNIALAVLPGETEDLNKFMKG